MHKPLELLINRLKGEFPKDDHGKKAEFIRQTRIPRITLDRWISGKTSPKIEELGRLSIWFKCEPWELIAPPDALPTVKETTPLEALSIIEKALKSQLQKTGENLQQTIEKAPHHIPANQKPELPAEYVEIIEALKARPLKIDEVRAALGITAARVVSRSPAKKDQS